MGQGPTKDARLHADDHTPTQKFLDCLASAFVDADVDEDGYVLPYFVEQKINSCELAS